MTSRALTQALLTAAIATLCLMPAHAQPTTDSLNVNPEKVTSSQMIFAGELGDYELRGRVWFWAAESILNVRDAGEAIKYCDRALPILHASDDRLAEASCLALQCMAHSMRREWNDARQVALQSVSLAQQVADSSLLCSALSSVAYVSMKMGDLPTAESYMAKALAHEHHSMQPLQRCRLFGIASMVYCSLGRYAVAVSYADDGLLEAESNNVHKAIGPLLGRKSRVLLKIGRLARAKECISSAIKIFQSEGNSYQLGLSYLLLGKIHMEEDARDLAATCFDEAASIFTRHDDTPNVCQALEWEYRATPPTNSSKRDNIQTRYDNQAKTYNDNITKHNIHCAPIPSLDGRNHLINTHKALRIGLWIAMAAVLTLVIITTVHVFRKRRRKAGIRHSIRRLLILIQRHIPLLRNNNDALTESDQRFLARLAREVRRAMKNGDVSVESVAYGMRLPEDKMRNRLMNVSARTAEDYIKSLRIMKARQLIDNTMLSVHDVARACAYHSYDDFAYDFSEILHLSPSSYRQQRGLQ